MQVELRPIFVQGERQGQRLLKLNIFGPVSQAKLAEKEMSIVISELAKLIGQKSEKAAKFAKISAKSDEQKAMEEKDFESYTKAREFCRVPADDAVFARCVGEALHSLTERPLLAYDFDSSLGDLRLADRLSESKASRHSRL